VQAVTCLLAAEQAASGDKLGWKVLRLVQRLLCSQIITHHWFNASVVLTFGTISSLYGLNARIIDQTLFSVLVTDMVLRAILPTIVAQRWFTPLEPAKDQPSWERQIG
jgi:hypothetical protein